VNIPTKTTKEGRYTLLRLEVSYRAIIVAVLVVAAIWSLFVLWPVLVILLTSLIFMAALLPYVDWLVERGIPRVAAVVVIMLSILVVLVGLAVLVVPAMIDEFTDLRENLPEDARETEDFLEDIGINVELEERARNIDWDRLISGEQAIDYGQRALALALALLTIFVLTAYLLADTPRMTRFMYQFVPPGYEPEMERWTLALRTVVGGYIRGQLITSACIALFTFIVLTAVGVPNAVAFAVLAAFVDIIPIVGAVIAVFMPTIAAFQESPTQALIVLVLLMLYQQFEDRILAPRVYGSTLNLPPVIVLIAVLVGGQLFGIAGVLLALPGAAVARVVLDYYLEKRSVGQAGPTTGGEEVLAPDPDKPAA
jgi:predicted PurR-regulated permease PerM